VWALRPHELEGGSLLTAIAVLIEQIPHEESVSIDFSHQGIPYPLSPDMEHDLLRLCQEAINNALKHAHANQIRTELIFAPEQVELRVEDDGQGFDPDQRTQPNSFGLRIMEERVAHLGGQLILTSNVGQGTCVIVLAPRDRERHGTNDDDKIAENPHRG
jgi:signal transduction histidine kinase